MPPSKPPAPDATGFAVVADEVRALAFAQCGNGKESSELIAQTEGRMNKGLDATKPLDLP